MNTNNIIKTVKLVSLIINHGILINEPLIRGVQINNKISPEEKMVISLRWGELKQAKPFVDEVKKILLDINTTEEKHLSNAHYLIKKIYIPSKEVFARLIIDEIISEFIYYEVIPKRLK